jgi:hypothetical protein
MGFNFGIKIATPRSHDCSSLHITAWCQKKTCLLPVRISLLFAVNS